MKEEIEKYLAEVNAFTAADKAAVELFHSRFTSKKGLIAQLFNAFKELPDSERRSMGRLLNELKRQAEGKLAALRAAELAPADETFIDLSLPPIYNSGGGLHPISLIRQRIVEIFERLGFNVADGPEIEDNWHNFSALNFPENHPAREMQDTFFLDADKRALLRTHTSNVQIRLMSSQPLPIRSIMPGRVYRNETVSARANLFFNQVEGLYVDKNVSFADLKQTLYHFAGEMYGEVDVRFRPSFFPFTEPSAEIDISCLICRGKGCPLCKYSGWVEIAGSGMVHPNVLKNCHIDPEEYSGFAFGMGIERIAQLKYRVNDIRLYEENDIRFLKQFSGLI